MVKHVILWQLKDGLSDSEKTEIRAGIKESLESLSGKIPGLIRITRSTGVLKCRRDARFGIRGCGIPKWVCSAPGTCCGGR